MTLAAAEPKAKTARADPAASSTAISGDRSAHTPMMQQYLRLLTTGASAAIAERYDTALPLLEQAVALCPAPRALYVLSQVHDALGRPLDALASLDRSLALRNDPRTLLRRGDLLRRLGRNAEAGAAFTQVVALEPRNSDAWACLAGVLTADAARTGTRDDIDAAVAAHRTARACGADPVLADYALAALGASAAPDAAPRRYVEGLFDSYANVFDAHLRNGLEYRTPEALVAALIDRRGRSPSDIVDLGCGTGLCGPLLRPIALRLTGVDLSARMLDVARGRGCYDQLEHAELVEHLQRNPAGYDIAIAADVLVYIGDLQPLFAAAHGAIRANGWLAVSIEGHIGEGFALRASRRYTHSTDYVHGVAAAVGFEIEGTVSTTIRREADTPVRGTVVLLRRLPTSARLRNADV